MDLIHSLLIVGSVTTSFPSVSATSWGVKDEDAGALIAEVVDRLKVRREELGLSLNKLQAFPRGALPFEMPTRIEAVLRLSPTPG
jgi:hypothetical protein